VTPREEINRYLAKRGLGQLGDDGLISQLAFLVRDHLHFQSLLTACEPELRTPMYEALAPNLSFRPKPLASYLIEAARDAEARQLPVIGADGELQQYYPPEVSHHALDPETGEAFAVEGLAAERGTESLDEIGAARGPVDGSQA